MSENETKNDITEESKPEIIVNISSDKMKAFVTVIFPGNVGTASSELILNELKKNGVIYGIDQRVLDSLEGKKESILKLHIASGKMEKNGENGTIKQLIDSEQSNIVLKGDKIAQIEAPTKGEDGLTVANERIPGKPGKELQITEQKNVEPLKENPNVFCSKVAGYLEIGENKLVVKAFFELEISDDSLEAWITVIEPHDDDDFSKENAIGFLGEKNIKYGIKEANIDLIFKEKKFGEKITIAVGEKPEDGEDGYLKYHYDNQVGPKEDEKGNVNYKDLNLIQDVKKGDKIVEIMPSTEGKKGKTVLNQEIPAKPGEPKKEPNLTNASTDPKNPNFIIAKIDGHVHEKGGAIIVDPVYYVKENVDYETGNIDCEGSVCIGGDVKSGFSVKTKNDVEVGGIVEDAVIEAGGNVMLKSGFSGRGEGKIVVKGNLFAQYCENQTIICHQDLNFCEYIMRGKTTTLGKLSVCEKKGLIVGGEVFAQMGVEANVIGNLNYTHTTIEVGVNKEANEKYLEKKAELSALQEKLEYLEKSLNSVAGKKNKPKSQNEEKQSALGKLKLAKDEMSKKLSAINSEIDKINEEKGKYKDALVVVHETVFPNTKIIIFDKRMDVNEESNNVVFKYSDEGIIVTPGT